MTAAMHDFLQANPLIVLFPILGVGLLIGRLEIDSVELGSVTGVLLVGLLVGHVGIDIPSPSAALGLGFVLFIYCVGAQAGPRFVNVFREDGLESIVLALITAVTATLAHKKASPHIVRHTTAVHLLHAGIDTGVIALWLGHENLETTHVYLEADLETKEQALGKVDPLGPDARRFKPNDTFLSFLESL